MNIKLQTSDTFRYVFLICASVIVMVSLFFMQRMADELAIEEKRKIEVWAEATTLFITADENTDIDFISGIIEGNTTIPVYMTDDKDSVLFVRNVSKKPQAYARAIERLKEAGNRIEVMISPDDMQYIYYDDSHLLRMLQYYPYVQYAVIALFLCVAFVAFASIKNAEQNKVWVGLSKETAHQLGTPISSLLAWTELLKMNNDSAKYLPEIVKDVERLHMIAERFSKIGSQPELLTTDLRETLRHAMRYMEGRISKQVDLEMKLPEVCVYCNINTPLMEWVVENIVKNAIDAMEGKGKLCVQLTPKEKIVVLDFIDTGRGITHREFKKVFRPGYTTKQRGWGLGLSLVRRIVEEYHKGKVYVKQSEIGVGTTIRVELPLSSVYKK
ncbi:MAG: HAMP domain-containing histidine kinase [Paludibacteraceae bacterium]|nr:HAMP domain-containing histidine kinase [Paludibacteraceae bacterium]